MDSIHVVHVFIVIGSSCASNALDRRDGVCEEGMSMDSPPVGYSY